MDVAGSDSLPALGLALLNCHTTLPKQVKLWEHTVHDWPNTHHKVNSTVAKDIMPDQSPHYCAAAHPGAALTDGHARTHAQHITTWSSCHKAGKWLWCGMPNTVYSSA
jgi:hypothetical protein